MKAKLFTGTHGPYKWVECPDELLSDLLEAVPSLVVGKCLVNTCFDSGWISLSSEDIEKGWHQRSQPERAKENLRIFPSHLTFISPIARIEEIPHDQYDEWYVFDIPAPAVAFDKCEVFVNWCGFSLQDEGYEEFRERFWLQVGELAPETYLSENDRLICVTRNTVVFEDVLLWAQSREGF